jgi:hypothetical protein
MYMAKFPTFKMIVTDSEEDGVMNVALVDEPATEQQWQFFEKCKQLFKAEPDKRIVSGALMVADLPIYRRDEQNGEYYVTFDSDTIVKIAQKYFKQKFTSNVNLMHDPAAQVQGVYMFESFIVDSKRGINTPKGFDTLPDGSWFGSFKVDNQEIWDTFIKTGQFKGFSVEGVFRMEKEEKKQDLIKQIENILNQVK